MTTNRTTIDSKEALDEIRLRSLDENLRIIRLETKFTGPGYSESEKILMVKQLFIDQMMLQHRPYTLMPEQIFRLHNLILPQADFDLAMADKWKYVGLLRELWLESLGENGGQV